MSAAARLIRSEEGSRPNSRSCESENVVAVHGWPTSRHSPGSKSPGRKAPPAHCPSSSWHERSLAPQPSVSTLARCALHCGSGASIKSRITCQRIDGSESKSQSITEPGPATPARLATSSWNGPRALRSTHAPADTGFARPTLVPLWETRPAWFLPALTYADIGI